MPLYAFDTETFRISQEAQHPKLVCLSIAGEYGDNALFANATPNDLKDAAQALIEGDDQLVAHNTGFDLAVLAANYPDMIPAIYRALIDGRVTDTIIREKLLILAESGDLAFLEMPDGSKSKRDFKLESLTRYYLNKDRSAEKNESDAWRTNYAVFDGVPLEQWPPEARKYAQDDADDVFAIYHMQETRRQELISRRGIDPFITEHFRTLVDFCLKLMTGHGAATDAQAIVEVEKMLAAELADEKLDLLLASGILRPAVPPRPHKTRGRHVTDLATRKEEWVQDDQPVKMTKGEPASIDTKKLKEYILQLAKTLNGECDRCNGGDGIDPDQARGAEDSDNHLEKCKKCKGTGVKFDGQIKIRFTAPSTKFPEGQLSTDAEFLEDFAHLDPVLSQYKHRQDLQKIVSTEIPRMKIGDAIAPVVYPQYDCLKETGRTSSFSSKSQDYASFNCQNVDPRVRKCFVPRPGHLLFSIDYSQMELGTLAQTCFDLFGYSVLMNKINAGVDVHAYTGAQLAHDFDPAFRASCGTHTDRDEIARLFMVLANGNDEQKAFYSHWRKFAKPVNLGYPGGLGADTFRKLAKVAYDVIVDVDMAERFRDLWKETYPEMVDYFNHINKKLPDPHNKGWDKDEEKEITRYCYTTPYGMHRAGCGYCAAANGLGLQSPSAEGALTGMCDVMQGCWDPSVNSVLLGARPWGFIHDELVGEVPDDDKAHDRMMEMKRLLVGAMGVVTPNVKVNATPCLMRRWDKDAKPVFDPSGRLTVWVPKVK